MGVWTWSFGHVVPNFIIFLLEIILACITRIDALMITLELIDLLIDNSFIQLNILILCIELWIHLLNEITINILCWKICKIPIQRHPRPIANDLFRFIRSCQKLFTWNGINSLRLILNTKLKIHRAGWWLENWSFFFRMILIKILLDKIYWSAFTVENEFFKHVNNHFLFLIVKLLFRLVFRNVWRKKLAIKLLKCRLQIQIFWRI